LSTTSTRGESTGRHDQALIDKVQKLLRLATSDVEHGLSMEAVSQQQKTQRGVSEEIAQKETSGVQYWQKWIASALAKQFRCRKQSAEAKREYMLGYARGLYKAFEQRNRARALALRKNPQVDAYVRRLNLRTEAAPHRARRPDAHARSNGFTEGKRAHAAGRSLTAAASG
jgi:hypothetical protein